MSESRDIRNPVFGFISINGTESNIVNSPIFQRLRRIRQLAFAHLVYPGALHTRFEHSLGVCHIASLLADSLGLESDKKSLSGWQRCSMILAMAVFSCFRGSP